MSLFKRKNAQEEAEQHIPLVIGEDAKTAIEREIRRYVRKDGGYRKGQRHADSLRAKALLDLLGRKAEDGWDQNIYIEGFDYHGS